MTKVFSCLPIGPSHSLVDQIGEGTFSTVYLARRKEGGSRSQEGAGGGGTKYQEVALKHLVPTSKPQRIMTEVLLTS